MVTSSADAVMSGFIVGTGASFRNNVIRLGIDASGNPVTTPVNIRGFYKNASAVNSYYHNTVYIGGTGVTTGLNSSAAFYRFATSGTDSLLNNIFMNCRSTSDATSTHFALLFNGTGNIISDYNVFYVNGTGGNIASFDNAATLVNSIKVIRETLFNQELHSGIGNPNFVNSAGTGAALNLHVQSPTPVEGSGLPLDLVPADFSGNLRSSLTPADIGAYAGNYTVIDYFTPNFSYTPLTPGRISATRTAAGITISDIGTGVPTSGSLKPRIWYRNRTKSSSWASAAGVLNSGNGNNGVWNFTIDYLLSGGIPSMGDTIQYYFVAQDQASGPYIWYSPFAGASHTNVSTQISPPTAPLEYVIYAELSGTMNVPGDYSSLTKSNGLFAMLKNAVLSGNLTINITSNLSEDGTVSLSSVYQEVPGTYHLYIKPSAASVRTITGPCVSGLINIEGVRDVVIDGSYNGTGKYLFFQEYIQCLNTFIYKGCKFK